MSSVLVGILSETRLFSDGVSHMVSAESSVQLIEADEEALADQSSRVRPNVVLLDGRQDNVLTLCRRLCAAGLKIIVLAVAVDGPLAADALIAGACGILYRSARTEDVVQAIAHVQQGLLWAPRHVVAAAWSKSTTKAHRRRAHRRLAESQRPRARGAAARGGRPREQGARRSARHQRGDRQSSPHAHLSEGRMPQSGRARRGLSRDRPVRRRSSRQTTSSIARVIRRRSDR